MFLEGTQSATMEFNGDTNANYSRTYTANGATDVGQSDKNYIGITLNTTTCFISGIVSNNASQEKYFIQHNAERMATGHDSDAKTPESFELYGKWVRTSGSGTGDSSAQITRIDLDKAGSNFTAKSILKVWGHD